MSENESDAPEKMRRMSIFLDAQSDADIETIKRCAGLSSASAAIRSALRQQARQMRVENNRRMIDDDRRPRALSAPTGQEE